MDSFSDNKFRDAGIDQLGIFSGACKRGQGSGVVNLHERGGGVLGIVRQDRRSIEPVAILPYFSYGEIPHVCRNSLN